MTQLLFGLVFMEMALIVVLLFRNPLRMLLILGLDRMKRGRAQLVAGTLATTMAVVFSVVVYNIMGVQRRLTDSAIINPTDEVLMAHSLLDASLMGFSLFLGILIDRLHYYVKELYLLRNNFDATKKWKRDYVEMDSVGPTKPPHHARTELTLMKT